MHVITNEHICRQVRSSARRVCHVLLEMMLPNTSGSRLLKASPSMLERCHCTDLESSAIPHVWLHGRGFTAEDPTGTNRGHNDTPCTT